MRKLSNVCPGFSLKRKYVSGIFHPKNSAHGIGIETRVRVWVGAKH